MERIIFHIDVNSAFLSWSAIKMLKEGKKEDIRNVPTIIGGDQEKRHGVVLAKSIPAKKYGIKTGEPIVDALKKCSDIVIIPPSHDFYEEQSFKFIQLLEQFTPDIEQVSIDECYFDYTGIQREYESPVVAANIIKNKMREELGFTVNIGISSCKILAKMASDFTKPDKVHTLFPEEIKSKMWPLPVEELFMVGRSTAQVLHKLGIGTIGELANTPKEILILHLKSHGHTLWEYSNGIDSTPIKTEREELKGIGNSTTLSKDIDNIEEVGIILLQLAERVASRLRNAKQKALMVSVEIKYADFSKTSHQTTLQTATNSGNGIYDTSYMLFKNIWNGKPVRLLGIRTSKLLDENEPEQLNMFDIFNSREGEVYSTETKRPSREKIKKLDAALDEIKKKYGENSVSRASLLNEDRIQRH